MGELDPETLIILAAGAAVLMLLLVVVVRRLRVRRPPDKAPVATPAFGSVKPAEHLVAVETAPSPAPGHASYAAIAAAQASRAAPRPVKPAAMGERIDYSNALAGIRPDSSYTAIAIASLLGQARNQGE